MNALTRSRSLCISVMGLAIALAVLAVAVGSRTSSASAASADSAPAWVTADVNRVVASFGGAAANVASSNWVKTTWGEYVEAVGSNGDSRSAQAAYVVVVRGDFVYAAPVSEASLSETIKGRVLVIAYDAASQELSNVSLYYADDGFAEATLGQMSALELSAN